MVSLNPTSFYPPTWPVNPFHVGEVQVQKKLGVESHVMSYAPKVVRPYMPDQHRDFLSSQPFLVVAARDDRGRLWSTLLFASDPNNVTSFVTTPDPTSLSIDSRPLPGDALEGALQAGSDLGILGIEFAARRRNRVNGRLVASSSEALRFKVDQGFGNCPQYIKPRDWWTTSTDSQANTHGSIDDSAPSSVQRSTELSKDQIVHIQQAETIFLATGYRGEGEDPRFGNDASHRGGAVGFLRVDEGFNKLYLPDYSGNNHYNTLGNVIMDSRMGITIPLYETGGMIQLTGTAIVDWDEEAAAAKFIGAKRVIEFTIDEVVELPAGSMPIRWTSENNRIQVQVAEKIYESEDVASFYLSPIQGDAPSLPSFEPGQHLPIELPTSPNEAIVRTYSLSASSINNEYYRISVKKHSFGLASRFLHDQVQVGDVLTIQKPAGHFTYDHSSERTTLVLLSSGIGITPVLSMLHNFVEDSKSSNKKKAFWIHGARDGKHHPFQSEVETLKKLAGDRLETQIAYSKPNKMDSGYDSEGRITVEILHDLVKDLSNADMYMCGSLGFMADMESGLESLGVDSKQIHFESF